MNKSLVDPECTRQFSSLFLDYIQQKPTLANFYNEFPSLENFERLIKSRDFKASTRKILHQVISEQYHKVAKDHSVHQQIDRLLDEKTFTVTTGHQLNLMTGPLYFIYKIVTTINLAKKLKSHYPDYHFVPVYWMASEDHDFEEINYFKYEGKKYTWESGQKGPVGEFIIDDSLRKLINDNSFIPAFFKKAFLEAKNLSEAVHSYVHQMFGNEGLVIVDANHPQLKKEFAFVAEKELFESKAFELVNEQSKKLEDLGYKSQISPRPINLFYMEKGLRERIEKTENGFQVLNTSLHFTEEEMREICKKHPEKLSPNVVLRPLYQEIILPNLAYIGGPAEVIYWLQLKPVFDYFSTPFPSIFPRNFASIIQANTQRKISRLGLTKEEIFSDFDEWKKSFIQKHSEQDLTLGNQKQAILEVFNQSVKTANKIDVTLSASFKAAEVKTQKILDHLATKLRKAEQRRMSDQLEQMKDIQSKLFPGGSPQERVVNFLEFFLLDKSFFKHLYENFDPFTFQFILLETDHGQS